MIHGLIFQVLQSFSSSSHQFRIIYSKMKSIRTNCRSGTDFLSLTGGVISTSCLNNLFSLGLSMGGLQLDAEHL